MVNPISLGLHVLRGKDPVRGKVILIVGNRVFHSANQSTSPSSIRIHKYVTSCETGHIAFPTVTRFACPSSITSDRADRSDIGRQAATSV